MLTSSLGNYNFYVYTDELDYTSDPFCYIISIRQNTNSPSAGCFNIPCGDCLIAKECDKGRYKTKAINAVGKKLFPELYL